MTSGCEQPPPVAPRVPAAVEAKVPVPTSFTFTKVPATNATHAITSPVTNLETIVFSMVAARADGMVVKQFGFMISGSLQAGDVRNYQLVYYPKGLSKPGVVMGTNDGSTWVAPGGSPSSFIYIDLASPITIPKGKSFTAYFALHADVTGTGTFFFDPRVQTCLVNSGGVDQDVAWFGGDLPLQGDVFNVN
ncbi:MAG TPA: hypothetical protein VFI52_04725 [Gemmatimonadaceae bacterium]|nr:hypothetical protein [Gemmatimonadaceae bacterium]